MSNWPLRRLANSNPLVFEDLEALDSDMRKESERIFVPSYDVNFQALCEGSSEVQELSGIKDYKQFLEETSDKLLRIFIIPQFFSWAELDISEECMRVLLSDFDVMPEFWDVIKAFGSKDWAEDEGYGTYLRVVNRRKDTSEVCYVAKHAEENGKNDPPKDPWSLRHIGVYHQTSTSKAPDNSNSDLEMAHNTFVIINPSKRVHKLLVNLCKAGVQDPEAVHMIIAKAVTVKWKSYLSEMEYRILSMKQKSYLKSSTHDIYTQFINYGLSDSQYLYLQRDKLLSAQNLLGINQRIFIGLGGHFRPDSKYQVDLVNLQEETKAGQCRIKIDLKSLEGTLTALNNLLNWVAMEKLTKNGETTTSLLSTLEAQGKTTTEISQLARQDTIHMSMLAKKSREDAKTIMMLTVLAVTFVPATFVAQVLGMGYITIKRVGSRLAIHVAGELWMFVVLTVILTAATFAGWWILSRKRAPPGDEESIQSCRRPSEASGFHSLVERIRIGCRLRAYTRGVVMDEKITQGSKL